MDLNSFKNPYLNLGCGEKIHHDWINIDFISGRKEIISFNLLQKLPFEDNSIKYIYHSHLLEHFSESDGFRFSRECYRVLQKDGILRVVLPDFENIINYYVSLINRKEEFDNREFFKLHRWILIELFDQMIRESNGGSIKECLINGDNDLRKVILERIGPIEINQEKKIPGKKTLFFRIKRKLIKTLLTEKELKALKIGLFRESGEIHKWMYDKYSLSTILEDVGFNSVEPADPFTSKIPDWESYCFDVRNGIVLNPTSLYIEAIK